MGSSPGRPDVRRGPPPPTPRTDGLAIGILHRQDGPSPEIASTNSEDGWPLDGNLTDEGALAGNRQHDLRGRTASRWEPHRRQGRHSSAPPPRRLPAPPGRRAHGRNSRYVRQPLDPTTELQTHHDVPHRTADRRLRTARHALRGGLRSAVVREPHPVPPGCSRSMRKATSSVGSTVRTSTPSSTGNRARLQRPPRTRGEHAARSRPRPAPPHGARRGVGAGALAA